MITQGESGLSPAEYANLQVAVRDPTLKVELEQYSLSFAAHDTSGHAAVIDNFDAIVVGTTVVRVWAAAANVIQYQRLTTEDGGDQAWTAAANLAATNIDLTVPISLSTDGVDVRVFYYDGTGDNIEYFESGDEGANWGATQLVLNVADVAFLAATSLSTCHYLTLTAKSNHRFHAAVDAAGWGAVDSDLYWPWPIDSFDASPGGSLDDGAASTNDILLFTTDFPPIIGIRTEDTQIVHKIEQVQGIAAIRYQNTRWGNHIEFDVTDNAPLYPARHNLRVSADAGWLYLCYHRVGGTAGYTNTHIALSRSKTGLNWELPYVLTEMITGPSILLKRGHHAYLVNSKDTYRSLSQGYTNDPQTTQDITSRLVSFQAKMGDIAAFNMTAANPQQALDATSPFADDVSMQARIKLGYVIGGVDHLVQTALADVDAIGGAQDVPRDHEVVQSRDMGARLLTFCSDHVVERINHVVGGDNFETTDGSDYTGMRHTAPLDGSWKTPDGDNELALLSNQSGGLAVTTYLRDAWNGTIQAGWQVADDLSNDWAGVAFRIYDKGNLLYAKYDATDTKIHLLDRRDDVDLGLAETVALALSTQTWYWIMLRVRYGMAWVYHSADGLSWSEQFSQELGGMAAGTAYTWANYTARLIPLGVGRAGYIGHGYSDEPDEYPSPPPPAPGTPPDDSDDPGCDQWIFGTEYVGVYYTNNLTAVSPNYHDMSNGLESPGSLRIADLKIVEWVSGASAGKRTLFAATDCGIYEYMYLPPPGGSWVFRQHIDDLLSLAGASLHASRHCRFLRFSIEHEGYCCCALTSQGSVHDAYLVVAVTHDGWKTIHSSTIVYQYNSFLAVTMGSSEVAYAQHSDAQTIYVSSVRSWPGSDSHLWKSTNEGITWSQIDSDAHGSVSTRTGVWVPYVSVTHNDNVIWWSGGGDWFYSDDWGAAFISIATVGSSWSSHPCSPTYSGTLGTLCDDEKYWEYSAEIGQVQFGPDLPTAEAFASFVMERGADLRVDKVLMAGRDTFAPLVWIYVNDGVAVTDKMGDWVAITGGGTEWVTSIARHEYSSMEVYP